MSDTVSVIIANYNRSQQLINAVESVLRQTYPVLEVLVCDDGSTDDSKERILALSDHRVRWIDCGRNGRPAVPRNKGISQSKGEWIAILDNDDEWTTDKIEKQLNAAIRFEAVAVCSNAIRISAQESKDFFNRPSGYLTTGEMYIHNPVICSSMIFQRTLLSMVKGFPEQVELRALEDYALWLRIAACGRIYYLEDKLVKYTDIPSSGIRKNDVDAFEQMKRVFSDFKSWADQWKPEISNDIGKLLTKINRTRLISKVRRWFR